MDKDELTSPLSDGGNAWGGMQAASSGQNSTGYGAINTASEESASTVNYGSIVLLVLLLIGGVSLVGLTIVLTRRWFSGKVGTPRHNAIDRSVQDRSRSRCCEQRGFCSFPQDRFYVLLSVVYVSVGFANAVFATSRCDFLSVMERFYGQEHVMSVGIWRLSYEHSQSYASAGTCVSYPAGSNVDAYIKASRAMAVLSVGMGSLTPVLTLAATCVTFSNAARRLNVGLLGGCCLFQGLTFLIGKSDYCVGEFKCELDWGAYASIVACLYWAVSLTAVALIPNEATRQSLEASRTTAPV